MYRAIFNVVPVKQLVVLAAVIFMLCRPSGPLEAQQINQQQILEGIYTQAQADRGASAYKRSCINCHIPRDYATLIQQGPNSKNQIAGYYDLIRQTMPQDAPGTLSEEVYLNLMAYILSLNKFPVTEPSAEPASQSSVNGPQQSNAEINSSTSSSPARSEITSPALGSLNVSDNSEIEQIRVTVTRLDQSLLDVPSAVSLVNKEDIQVGRQQLGLDESLNRVPGMFFQNRYNFTQDLRVSIRGFGARANFGIRGLKIISDGIPATLTDGQSGTDDLDIGSVDRIEILRGPSSSLYGSASGGVISLYTEDGPEVPFVEASVNVGEYDHQKYQAKAGGQFEKLNYLLNISTMSMDGYREHSRVEHSLINSKFRYDIDSESDLTIILNAVDSPMADDPGAITEVQVAQNPQQAEARNLSSNAGEAFEQQKFGLIYNRKFDETRHLTLSNYYLWKNFSNILPLGTHIPMAATDGVVEFDRFFYGGGAQYSQESSLFGLSNNTIIGIDIDAQKDDRQRFINNAGIKGNMSFDQLEHAQSYGFYIRNELAFTDTVNLSVGGRYDIVELSVEDRFLTNADQSGELDFKEFSPAAGISWRALDNISLYTNYAFAFETPTFTELANPARSLNVNLGGFANVTAQNADSFEIGAKGMLFDRINFELALYTSSVKDEVISTVNIGNRAFFQNADTDRQGLEAALQFDIIENLKASIAYTYSDFKFDVFETTPLAVGNKLPGLPDHQFYTELAYRNNGGFFAVWDFLYISEVFVNNLNSVINPDYHVSNFRIGNEFRLDDIALSPFVGINNLFNENYNGNVAINAFGNRYFEPAPTRNIYGGLTARYFF